ncbi:MAG TPA: Gfo/Idh/MocA family oxidoreductase [Longimicrobiaceae bacterium]|nr:Gfo/Idh/MocA family oxidoreductase [Longimicrobiaceae bacterium]
MNGSALPVGVVGVGSLGFHHARILRDVPGARLAGVYDVDEARAARVAEELGVRAFAALEELLAGVEAAVVAVPTTRHAEVALAALERGVHLLIEKPIASTLEEADRIVGAAEAAGVLVATGHVERFNGALRACEEHLEGPRFVESHRLAPFNPRGTDVAVVLDLMIHDIDLVLGLVGREVEEVHAIGVPVLTGSTDIANARMGFEGGAVANITASRVSLERMRKIRFFQSSGYMSLDLAAGTGEFLRLRKGARLPEGEVGPAALLGLVDRVELRGDGNEPLRAELESWVRAVRGEGPLVVSGHDGRRALAVALDILGRIEHNGASWQPA